MTEFDYESFAIRYATRDAQRSAHFIGGDPHDGPMPMDIILCGWQGGGGRYFCHRYRFQRRSVEEAQTHVFALPRRRAIRRARHARGVLERCMLMTTDPGDLVLDPTCGSGTTAFVAEQWGRRWITIDTSRVALGHRPAADHDREVRLLPPPRRASTARPADSITRPSRTSRSRASRRTPDLIRSSPDTSRSWPSGWRR